jgi:hypothetical protein
LLEPDPDALELYRSIQASRTPQALIEPLEASEATPVPAKPVTNTAHKRQISQAIPRDERTNAPEDEQAQAQALGDPQEGQEASRRSGRACKPKLRN